jgi:cobalt-zinc-cadmium efflux system protein
MKSDKKILLAFILNLLFSAFEFIGGALTGSVAIASDALHDLGDAITIGISYFLEKKSQRCANHVYTFGYMRYSVIGAFITSAVLIVGSVFIVVHAIQRLFVPMPIYSTGMLLVAAIGTVVNFIAACITHKGHSANQRAVNLHMLEDVLGWVVVLIGAAVMHFTHWTWIDPVLSISVALYIAISATTHCVTVVRVLAERAPEGMDVNELHAKIAAVDTIERVIALHVWSLDESTPYAVMQIAADLPTETKQTVRAILKEYGIEHATIECAEPDELTPVFAPKRQECTCAHHFPRIPWQRV